MVIAMIKKTLILSLMLQGAAFASTRIPEQIQPPAGYHPVLTVHAKGDQIYQCSAKQGEYSWQTLAPDAKLFDGQGNIVGNHSAGPLWEYKEGSRVVGKVLKKIDVAPGSAISWLLVEVVSHKGDGLFANVSFINRINTQGGLAPASACNANHLGSEKRVAYTADYVFYGK
ncbi:DUF3455 domain-containing protein [Candidatus Methylobacter oryzae]|uniref:DUF3455 domain-containing protein n=2 Tax=Candidatus Methylobacter oryzae TaxID=2497749 RepID=A0ABY3CC25_9GAMM|nr:DUF3455 domain-containing protein [Candidatus Methylobacter oryzae]